MTKFNRIAASIFVMGVWLFGFKSQLIAAPEEPMRVSSNSASPGDVMDLHRLVGDENFRRIVERTDNLGAQIPSLIFNAISRYGVSLVSTPRFGLNLRFGRDVYDNKSVLGTWTVVDQVGVDGSAPLVSLPNLVPGLMSGLNFYIGTNLGAVVTDIRQVAPAHYSKLPSIDQRADRVSRGMHFQDLLKTLKDGFKQGVNPGQWIHFTDELGRKMVSFLPGDLESHARFSKIWNVFLTPFRLPLTAERVAKMENNEIISYEGQGALQSGFGTGWSIDPSGLTQFISAGVSVSAFTRGTFRISVFKEDNSIVRVKVSKIGSLGNQWLAGADATPGILDNIVIVRNFIGLVKIIPFQLNDGNDETTNFEVTYQYDLATQTGRQAYENAVLGNLKPSDEMAVSPTGQWRTSLLDTGVVKLSDYQSISRTATQSNRMQLTFLFRQNEIGQVIDTEGVLTTADGTRRRLTALAQNTKEWSLIFNQFQKYQHNFAVNLDLDLCEKNPEACQQFPLQIEGRIDDSDTTQAALLHYILEMEDSVGQPQIFPRTPEIRDLRNFRHDPYHPFYFYHPGHDLGTSHFYYSLNLNAQQVQRFLEFPEKEMWGALEKAFQIQPGAWSTEGNRWLYGISRSPVSLADIFLNLFQLNWAPGTDLLHAERIYSKWRALNSISKPIQKAEALAKTFVDTLYSRNIVRLLRGVVAQEEVDFFVHGNNRVFGSVSRQGGTHLAFEDLASQMARSVELRKAPTPEELDPDLRVNEVQIRASAGGKVDLALETPIAPFAYYVDLTINDWSAFLIKNKLVYANVFKNPGQSAGESVISLKQDDQSSAWSELARHIQPNLRYLLRVAISKDGQKWGPVSQTEFRILR